MLQSTFVKNYIALEVVNNLGKVAEIYSDITLCHQLATALVCNTNW